MPTSPFGLSENPFVEGHDARFVYPSRAHLDVVARLRRGIENREPFVLVTGLSGSGKTIAVQAALSDTAPHTLVLIAASPSLSPAKFRERILRGFAPDDPAQAIQTRPAAGIEARLRAIHARGRVAFLVVDEAQNLGLPLLEELRVLSDLEADGRNLLQIVLAGQPRLEDDLSRPGGDALRQRIAVRCRLGLLRPEETEDYIRHRVSVAGGDPQLFTGGSCEALHRLTHGIPREINLLAGEALALAQTAGESEVTAGHIAAAAVLLGFRSVVRDSQPTRGAPKPVAVEAPEVAAPADPEPGPVECVEPEGPELGLCGLPDIVLPPVCDASPDIPDNEPDVADADASAPAAAEAVPVLRLPESPVVGVESVVPAPCAIPPLVQHRPAGPAQKATPASLESPEVDAWLARFRGPDGPPRIGSRLAVAPMVSDALEPRAVDVSVPDEPAPASAPPAFASARAGGLPRRRGSRSGHRWTSTASIAGVLLVLSVGGLVIVTSGRSLLRARPVAPAARLAEARTEARPPTVSPTVVKPPRVSPPPAPAAPRAAAQPAEAFPQTAVAAARTATPPVRRYGVEVATFILESRAVEERDRLAERISLPCRVSTSQEDGTEVYSVVVGPLASPEEAVRLSEDLAQRRLVGQARVVRWTASDSTRR